MSNKSKIASEVVAEYRKAKKERKIDFYDPYPWQLDFLNASIDHNQIGLICANRVGKTYTGCAAVTYHLIGNYPDWYKGRKFTKPVNVCVLGISGDQIRDVLQKELVGDCDLNARKFYGDGLIPVESIHKRNFITSTGVKGLLKEIRIKHKSGGFSRLCFRSQEQGSEVLRGSSYDVILLDEESKHRGWEIYGEAVSRTVTAQGGKGGLTYLTFTPENGLTPLVDMLLSGNVEGQYVCQVGWDDAPHLDEKTKKHLICAFPDYKRPAKTEGRVTFGDLAVWSVTEEDVQCEPFPLPAHFRRICGIDFGIDHPFAAVFTAYDADRDIIYVYDCFKVRNQMATQHAHVIMKKGGRIRVVYPHDGHIRGKGDGKRLIRFYEETGLNVFRMFSNPDNSQSLEVGIFELLTRMRDGRLKVFRTLTDFWDEFRKYRRDRNGKIVAKGDDIMSAFRYSAIMVQRFGTDANFTEETVDKYYPDLDY